MSRDFAWAWLDAFYDEGDIDIIFFWQLITAVSEEMDEDEDGNSKSFNKSALQRKSDALRLAKYLIVEMGDFEGYDYRSEAYFERGFDEFCEKIELLFDQSLLEDFTSSENMYITLRKIHKGKPAPEKYEIPLEIVDLFQER